MTLNRIATPLACALFLCFAILTYGDPALNPNEADYLIKSKQFADSSYLQADWSYGASTIRTHGALFSAFVAPLWMAGLEPVQIALTVRAVETVLFLLAVIALLRSLDLPLAAGLLGLAYWTIAGQMAIAGEWVLGGAEQKPFAYIAVIFALASAIRSQWYRMAIFLSVATWFHILIGGWSAIILFALLLWQRSAISTKQYLSAAALAAVTVAPALVLAVAEFNGAKDPSLGPVAPYESAAELLAVFRVPHHLDPSQFITAINLPKFFIVFAGLVAALYVARVAPFPRKIIISFTASAVVLALAGAIAYWTKHYWLLSLYPFRIADGSVPFLAYIIIPCGIVAGARHFTNAAILEKGRIAYISAVGLLLLAAGVNDVSAKSQQTILAWSRPYTSNPHYGQLQLYKWIRSSTGNDEQFLIPPWWYDFRILAQRPIFVAMKTVPNNDTIWAWYKRLQLANDSQAFKSTGFFVYPELESHYNTLSFSTLSRIAAEYNIDYYITIEPRETLGLDQVYGADGIYVYRLPKQ